MVASNSAQITPATGTLNDALNFMSPGISYKRIEINSVSYKGEKIGYILTYPQYHGPYYKGSVNVNLLERGGKVFFSVDENFNYGD